MGFNSGFKGLIETFKQFAVVKIKAIHVYYQRFPGWRSQILRQSAYDGGKIVNFTPRPPLLPRLYFWHSFLLGAE